MSNDFLFMSGQVLIDSYVFNYLNVHDLSLYLLVIIITWMFNWRHALNNCDKYFVYTE